MTCFWPGQFRSLVVHRRMMEKLYNSPKEEIGVVEPPQSIFKPPDTLGTDAIDCSVPKHNNFFQVTRENLPNAPEHAFLLHGILSSKECEDWVRATESTGFTSLEKVCYRLRLLEKY